MDINCLDGREKKIKIPSFGQLWYDRCTKKIKSNNYINQILEALFDNIEEKCLSCLINLCHYIAACYEEVFMSAAGYSGLPFF